MQVIAVIGLQGLPKPRQKISIRCRFNARSVDSAQDNKGLSAFFGTAEETAKKFRKADSSGLKVPRNDNRKWEPSARTGQRPVLTQARAQECSRHMQGFAGGGARATHVRAIPAKGKPNTCKANFARLEICSGNLWRRTAAGGTRESAAASPARGRPGGRSRGNSCVQRCF